MQMCHDTPSDCQNLHDHGMLWGPHGKIRTDDGAYQDGARTKSRDEAEEWPHPVAAVSLPGIQQSSTEGEAAYSADLVYP